MTDIVERLRYPMIGDAVYEPQLRLEAAEEIERLTAVLCAMMDATDLDEVYVLARRALEPKP